MLGNQATRRGKHNEDKVHKTPGTEEEGAELARCWWRNNFSRNPLKWRKQERIHFFSRACPGSRKAHGGSSACKPTLYSWGSGHTSNISRLWWWWSTLGNKSQSCLGCIDTRNIFLALLAISLHWRRNLWGDDEAGLCSCFGGEWIKKQDKFQHKLTLEITLCWLTTVIVITYRWYKGDFENVIHNT